MKDNHVAVLALLCLLLGVLVTGYTTRVLHIEIVEELKEAHVKDLRALEDKVESKEIQLQITQTGYRECRYIVDQIVIQPRPLEVE